VPEDYEDLRNDRREVSYNGNCIDHGLIDGSTSKVIGPLYLLPITELLLKACLGISDDRDFALGSVDL
jgi:hypothetical protein